MGSGSSPRKVLQRGWLSLALDAAAEFERKWAVLDNGVLWVYNDNVDGTVAEHVVPLHDAEVQFAPETMTVDVVLGTGRRLRLLAEAGEEYRRWKAAMHETAQLWHARRQMALMTVLDVAFSAPRVPAAPAGLAAGRLQAVQALAQLAAQAAALRARTRRAVTAVASTPPAQHQHLAVNGQAALPRFLRRAVADAVEKIWRACGRALSRTDDARLGLGEQDADWRAVYDGVLLLRDASDAFVTYCSLLRDLQAMLRSEVEGVAGDASQLALSPLRGLTALRDAVSALSAVIRCPEEEDHQRAALAALDSTMQRCWTELSKRPLKQDVGVDDALPLARPRGRGSSSCRDEADGDDEEAAASAQSPCGPLKGPASVRRLASRLQRDVVRSSVRRARKRLRVEGLSLLPDQPLDDSLEDANALEMADLCNSSRPPSTSPSTSSTCSSGTASWATETESLAPPPPPTPPRASPTTPMGPPMVPPRMAASAGGRPARPARPAPATVVLQRRRWPGQDGDQDQDGDTREQMLRRRRLVCSMASFVDEDQDQDNQGGTCAVIDLKDNAAVEVNPERPRRAAQTWRDRRAESIRDAPDVLDVPVTPATPNGGGRRALWCETQEVQRSGLLDRLNTSESALQEAKFEVLSSEESYLRSLDVLAHRVQALDSLQGAERDAITRFLDAARACSMRFVSALRALWSLDVMMRGLCTLMHKEALPGASLQQYIHIVSLQPRAASVLAGLAGSEEVEAGLAAPLVPLLSLPAQRASRLPLLLAAILRRLDQRSSEAVVCRAALDRLNQIVYECNEALRRAEQTERVAEFGRILKAGKQTPTRKSWSERKSSVIGRAKSFFLKSNNKIGMKTSKILTSTSSMLHLT